MTQPDLAYPIGRFATPPAIEPPDREELVDRLAAVHARWLACIRTQPPAAFARAFRHPERGAMTLDLQLTHYAWHDRHHLTQITALAARAGWS